MRFKKVSNSGSLKSYYIYKIFYCPYIQTIMIATHFHFCLKLGNYSALLILMRLRLAAMKALNNYEIC